ncbi:exopolysaccharide biosynthesis polyprenyl glycosylphosphotransferase [Polaribacter sp.]|nr:exopolysaccharide biosynthesis polyprenyl glycosylphosphotransferase [Polaribacter sp.]MDB9736275.1 exopolysaccharide biosynthesis polyprenyl glycosylphosphotransferase [Polaribacter sp.]
MVHKTKKYSGLIRPLIIVLDVILLNLIIVLFSKEDIDGVFCAYITILWLFIAFYTKFYNVYRYTHISKLLVLIIAQFFIFILGFFSYFTLFSESKFTSVQLKVLILIIFTIMAFKFFSFFLLKRYRSGGNNYRNVVVFGENKAAQNVANLFKSRGDLGYRFHGFFSDNRLVSRTCLGSIKEGLEYVANNNIDEIYCEQSSIARAKLKKIRDFCTKSNIELSLIPENKAIYSKDFILEHFGTIPILKPKHLPFERTETYIVKRIFDILFSSLVCVFLLSWLLPILWVLVKTDSSGAFFFKQIRDGAEGKQFYCYKIRSMKRNGVSNSLSATKHDARITRVGAFLRKTSLDELPQFFNVLKGDMSVVGPRPHMNIQTEKYLKEIDNYLIRNSVKPGITGLAQVSGYRGEVQTKTDIEHRVRLDIFYIENWSFVLDLKIVFQTIFKSFKGQEKAY